MQVRHRPANLLQVRELREARPHAEGDGSDWVAGAGAGRRATLAVEGGRDAAGGLKLRMRLSHQRGVGGEKRSLGVVLTERDRPDASHADADEAHHIFVTHRRPD